MQSINTISIVGSGNVANQLGVELFKLGVKIEYIFARNKVEGSLLATSVNAQLKAIDKINIIKQSQLLLLAIADGGIEEMVSKIENCEIIIAHTSGTVPSKVFAEKFKNYGIFYPLQTFTKNAIVDFNIIPFFILGSNEGVEKKLIDLAKIISNNVEIMDDVKRQKLHISAILVNNFVNHLFALSEQYCIENDLNFDLLKPLIGSTFNKVSNNISPTIVQTGPAKRGDLGTIMEHLEIIKTSKIKHLESIYTLLTASIIDLYKEKKDELPI